MACLVVLVIAATVLTAPPGKLTHAARTSSPEAFWRAALPDVPMPESIHELLRHSAEGNTPNGDDANVGRDDLPPPVSFSNYEDYSASSSPRDQAATAAPSANALEHVPADVDGGARAPPTVFFLEDAVRVCGSLPFPHSFPRRAAPEAHKPPLELYTVRDVWAVEGSSFVVCRRLAGSDGGDDVFGCRGVGPARSYVVDVAGERGDAVTATVVCHTGDHAAFRLLDLKPGGGAAVCYAVPDAQILLVKSEKVPSSV